MSIGTSIKQVGTYVYTVPVTTPVVHWGLLIIQWSNLTTSGSGELNSHFVSNHSAPGSSVGTRAV